MELTPSPEPFPTGSKTSVSQIEHITNLLRRHRLGDAFEALLDLGDQMHDMDDQPYVIGNLQNVNRLLSAIMQRSAYGVYAAVDRAIHTLLLTAIRSCEAQRTNLAVQTLPHGQLGWLSPAQSEINEHLEFYRNFAGYISSHPASSCRSASPWGDRSLDMARRLLQRLCPRINGLCKWTYTPPTGTDVTVPGAPRDRRRSSHCKSDAAPRMTTRRSSPRSSPRSRKPTAGIQPLMMPTPPTQSGDARLADALTVPTVPLRHPLTPGVGVAPLTPHSGSPSNTVVKQEETARLL
ncbi:hypothetical protein C8A03DRAFT_38530 [Achaetomium macrosporum]|uniref:Uncharacterized protein n=1 Tax=Achaetomium macrosporum TaxID=79813 RepID=A0AAN7C1R2_9PEZI|nr:hypothetical protein C8A03DRAFT_38530 [Achaetomium macrosporum]